MAFEGQGTASDSVPSLVDDLRKPWSAHRYRVGESVVRCSMRRATSAGRRTLRGGFSPRRHCLPGEDRAAVQGIADAAKAWAIDEGPATHGQTNYAESAVGGGP